MTDARLVGDRTGGKDRGVSDDDRLDGDVQDTVSPINEGREPVDEDDSDESVELEGMRETLEVGMGVGADASRLVATSSGSGCSFFCWDSHKCCFCPFRVSLLALAL